MFDLSLLMSSARDKNLSRGSAKTVKKKTSKKAQASRNQTHQAIELIWLQKLLTTKFVTVLLVLAVILCIPFLLPKEQLLPISKLMVTGDFKQIDREKLDKKLNTQLGKGFFSVNIKALQESISVDPWIKTVSIKRVWPSVLHVSLIEKIAIARWDNNHLLSEQADIFRADAKQFSKLPKINGYSGNSKELVSRYFKMQQDFSRQGIAITELSEDSKGALSLLLNENLKVNIGSENNKLKIRHLLAVYSEHIKPRLTQIKYIDFRYSNGFAIAWNDEYLKQLDDAEKRGKTNV